MPIGSRSIQNLVALALGLSLLACPRRAWAQSAAPPAAQSLFDQARLLMQEGHFEEACPKLAESQRLDPALGTLLNLAVCNEQLGRTATAYVQYSDALAMAVKSSDEARVSLTRRRIAELAPKLARLVVTTEDSPQDMWVRLDGTLLAPISLGSAIPVDPGSHTVEAGAVGKRSVRLEVEVGAEPATHELRVPKLVDESAPRPASPETPASERTAARTERHRTPLAVRPVSGKAARASTSTRTETSPSVPSQLRSMTTGALLAAGSMSLLLGAYFGLDAMREWDERNRHCPNGHCDQKAVAAAERADRSAVLANGFFAVGTVAGAAGLYLVLRPGHSGAGARPSGHTREPRVSEVAVVARGVF